MKLSSRNRSSNVRLRVSKGSDNRLPIRSDTEKNKTAPVPVDKKLGLSSSSVSQPQQTILSLNNLKSIAPLQWGHLWVIMGQEYQYLLLVQE